MQILSFSFDFFLYDHQKEKRGDDNDEEYS